MSFRDALGRHLLAIHEKNLRALADTVAEDGLVLVMSDGRLVQSTEEFLELHRAWFAMRNWNLDVKPVQVWETADLGVAVLRLDYREIKPDRTGTRQESLLTLTFQRRGGRWLMVHDQNTPIK
jgi:uncharacterized protein (TIGR02246 family)